MADEGFLSRWSRRKQDVKSGKPVEAEPEVEAGETSAVPAATPQPALAAPQAAAEVPPPPTLEDVESLTIDSDFRRFVTPDVAPEVKNAAVKKLFADPRYNVRDMMDVYADDYSLPDPMPESMIRKLASAQFLRLFEEKPAEAQAPAPREVADDVSMQTVAQSQPVPEAVPEPAHDDPDLRLQQDNAPAGEEPGHGAGRGAAAPHDPLPPRGRGFPEGGQG